MIKTDIKNFFAGDNIKFKVSNFENYDACNINFVNKKLNIDIKIPAVKQDINNQPYFVFKTKDISVISRYNVLAEYYNTQEEDDISITEPIGPISVLDKNISPEQQLVNKLEEDLEFVNDMLKKKARSDSLSYQIGDKQAVHYNFSDYVLLKNEIIKDLGRARSALSGKRQNIMYFGFRDTY